MVEPDSAQALGRYRLVRRLAIGEQAEIWLAQMGSAGGFAKNVVVKKLLPALAADEAAQRGFLEQARIAAGLQHPHIAQVFDAGVQGDDTYVAMEYLDGVDLHVVRGALALRQKGLPLVHSIHVVGALAAALHYAHDKLDGDGRPLGLVHRDVRPEHVVVTRDGGVKLLDFGRVAVGGGRRPSYRAPEQLLGEPVDRRTDVYALGVLLYELTCGRRLHGGRSDAEARADILAGRLARPCARQPRYPADLEVIVLRALAREPDARYPTARALGQALDGFVRERRLLLSSIALAEYLGPVIEETRAFVADRAARRARSATDDDDETRVAGGAGALAREASAAAATAATPPAPRMATAPVVERAPSARPVPPRRAPSDGDVRSNVSNAEVQVDLSDLEASLTRRRGGRVALAIALAAAGLIAWRVSRPAVPAGPAAPAAAPTAALALASTPSGAEVWLSLGRAPVDSPPLDPGRRYRVRVEHDGYVAVDVVADAADFRADGGRLAELTAELVPSELAPRLPAASPAADLALPPGLGAAARRSGRLRVTSSRDAAAVWLYLGATPLALDDLDASRRYELRVSAPGYTPYYRVIEPRDLDGRARVELAATLRKPGAPAPRQPIAGRALGQ